MELFRRYCGTARIELKGARVIIENKLKFMGCVAFRSRWEQGLFSLYAWIKNVSSKGSRIEFKIAWFHLFCFG